MPPSHLICSLKQNNIGSNGGIVIAEALKINTAITTIKYGTPRILL
jgi:hypothetical protein